MPFSWKAERDELKTIILLANYLPDKQESMQRYAGMLSGLLTQAGWRVETIRPEPFFGRLRPSGHGVGKWLGYLDKYVLFPFALRRLVRKRKRSGGEFLVHICDHSNAVYTRWLRDVPHLVTCHDVLAIQSARGLIPANRTGWTGRILQRWILSGLRGAAFVVCVSGATRRDLMELLTPEKGAAARFQVVENALNYPYAPMPSEQARREIVSAWDRETNEGVTPRVLGSFVFHVGGNHWYKNREAAIRIFGRLARTEKKAGALFLVMAGQAPTEAMRRAAREEDVEGWVIFAIDISDAQLCAFYSLAEALIFPSWREGFGWPIIEAQACGCPVVTSDLPPMSEIAGPAALLADPGDVPAFAACVAEVLMEGEERRGRRKEEALRHASRYDGTIFLQRMLGIYEAVLKGTPER